MKISLQVALVVTYACLAYPRLSNAGEQNPITPADGSIHVTGGVGYARLEGNEAFYDDFGRLSLLIWTTDTPVLSGSISVDLNEDWRVNTAMTVGLLGDNHMGDYDWLELSPSPNFNDWDQRSLHPDTDLNRYINLEATVTRSIDISRNATLDISGGVNYKNTKWTAYGGDYIYSFSSFRDTPGQFPDGQREATFEQIFPGAFVDLKATALFADWKLSGSVRGGISFNSSGIDDHWVRGVRFESTFGTIPFTSFEAAVEHSLIDNMSVTASLQHERYAHRRGDLRVYSIETDELVDGPYSSGFGMDFSSTTFNVGIKATF